MMNLMLVLYLPNCIMLSNRGILAIVIIENL